MGFGGSASDMTQFGKIRVYILDDSAPFRQLTERALTLDPSVIVVGRSGDPFQACEQIGRLKPDLIAMDVNIPGMDGVSLLQLLRRHSSAPVVVISVLARLRPGLVGDLQRFGAVGVIDKPFSAAVATVWVNALAARVKAVAGLKRVAVAKAAAVEVSATSRQFHPRQLIVIGSSTGGPEALKEILLGMPVDSPPILIAQHIQAAFSGAFAARMNQLSKLEVREARHGDSVMPGHALIAPGDYHMRVVQTPAGLSVLLDKSAPVHHCRPSVDVLFESAARLKGTHITACILTGMGEDGAAGMRLLKQRGARTLAQDEASCVVYGMPRAAKALGVVDRVVSLNRMADALVSAASELHPV